MTEPDSELVARAVASDDREAFSELVRRHQSAVRRFLRSLGGGDEALADDLAQEAFIRAHRGLPRFLGGSSFSTWVLGIAHNCWRNARRARREWSPLDEASGGADPAPSPAEATAARQDVEAALLRLPEEERAALHLCYRQGLSHPEIAAALGWPVGTVKTHIARGKERLRPLLSAWNPNP